MNHETEAFLDDLFARCDPQPAFLTLTAIHPDGDKPTPSRHVPLGNHATLERAVSRLLRANAQGWGAFVGIAPRTQDFGRWARGTKRDLVCLPALYVDIDEPEHALNDLDSFDLPPSCILQSGRGYHAYWFLDEPTTDFIQADHMLRRLAQHFHGDEGLSVAQSMRLPGTLNTKPGRENALCAFISYHSERRYRLDQFSAFMPKVVPYTYHPRAASSGSDGEVPRAVIDSLTRAVLYQLEGYRGGRGYIRACCPFPHEKDRPGMHFSYNAASGWGYCFGKHGAISPASLCRLLGVPVPTPRNVFYGRKHILDPLWSASLAA